MFAPIVYRLHQWLGDPTFTHLRSKAIALHLSMINWVSQELHLKPKCRQTLIKTAKNNGKRLGLMA